MTSAERLAGAAITVVPVDDRRQLDEFIRLPIELYRGHAGYLANLLGEQLKTLDRRKNPYFRHAEARYWLAIRGGRPVGRISAQVDRLYLERYANATGHFGFIDAVDDAAVFAALTGAAEAWLKGRGMSRCLGPFNLSINEECGLMVSGFDAAPMLMMGYSPAYAGPRMAEQGYVKAKDLISYDYVLAATRPIGGPRWLDKAGRGRVRLRSMDMKRYREELGLILDIFNDAWSDNWGFVPLTVEEIAATAAAMKPILEPRLVWIAEVDGKAASMIVCLPNLYEAIRDLGGRLLPLGWLKLLWRLKVSGLESARVPLFGVRKAYHRSALGSVLILTVIDSLRAAGLRLGYKRAELSWILEDNAAMRRVIEGVGGRAYKTYRVYEKALA